MNMKSITNFLSDFALEVMDNIAIGFGSVAIFLTLSLGSYSSEALIEKIPAASLGVLTFIGVWSFIVALMGTLVRGLGMLKKAETSNEVQQ